MMRSRTIAIALAGSLLMFAGWLLASVPAFHHKTQIAWVVVLAVIAMGLVLVPAGLDLFANPSPKHGAITLLVSYTPAGIIFLAAIILLPIPVNYKLLALTAEFAGMALYAWAWWRDGRSPRYRETGRRSA